MVVVMKAFSSLAQTVATCPSAAPGTKFSHDLPQLPEDDGVHTGRTALYYRSVIPPQKPATAAVTLL